MLRALVLKDLALLNYRLLFSLFLVPLTVMPMASGSNRGIAGTGLILLTMALFVSQAGLVEERSRADVLLHLLPVSRRAVVLGRYGLVGLLAAAMSAIYILPMAAIGPLVPAPPAPATLVQWWLWGTSVPLIFWSLLLPVVFAYGMTRTQMVTNTLLVTSVLTLMILGSLLWIRLGLWVPDEAHPSAVAFWKASWGWFSPTVSGALGLLGAAIVLTYLSYRLSVWIYGRRDF